MPCHLLSERGILLIIHAARPIRQTSRQPWTNAVCVASGRRMFKKATEPRFYRWARLIVSGREVMVVEAHLDWNITLPGYEDARVRQIQELIDDFKSERCVVIGGDFNTSRMLPDGKTEIDVPEDYAAFRAAGYAGAHWGTIKTWPAAKPFLTIDNIFAKGLRISEVRTLSDDTLSDHALMRCRLTFDDGGRSVAVAKPSDGVHPSRCVGREGASFLSGFGSGMESGVSCSTTRVSAARGRSFPGQVRSGP